MTVFFFSTFTMDVFEKWNGESTNVLYSNELKYNTYRQRSENVVLEVENETKYGSQSSDNIPTIEIQTKFLNERMKII